MLTLILVFVATREWYTENIALKMQHRRKLSSDLTAGLYLGWWMTFLMRKEDSKDSCFCDPHYVCVCGCKTCVKRNDTQWISNTLLPAICHLLSSYLSTLWMLSGVNSAQISPEQIEPLHAICFNLAVLHCQTHNESRIHLTIITNRTDPQLCNVWLQK